MKDAAWVEVQIRRQPRSAKWLMKKSGKSLKTIYRYLEQIEEGGVVLVRDKESRYKPAHGS